MNIFENSEELNVSEECFNDIINIVEEYITETKKANKEAHQEAIFKKLNPQGKRVHIFKEMTPEGKKAAKRLTNVSKNEYGDTTGTTHSLRDFRKLYNTDSPNSAPEYDYDSRKDERSQEAEDVRDALGRDKEFANEEPEPSKSSKAAKMYSDYKKVVQDLKNEQKREGTVRRLKKFNKKHENSVSEEYLNDIVSIMEDIVSYAYKLYGPRKGERIRRKVRAARRHEERMAANNEMKKNGGDYQSALRKVLDRRSEWNTAAGKELKQTLDSQDVKDTRKEIGKELRKRAREAKKERKEAKKERKENLINSLNNLFNNKEASDEAGRAHSDAQINKGLSEDLNYISDILDIVENLLQDTKAVRRNAVLNMKKNIKKAKNAESGSDEYLDARANALRNKLKADFAQNRVNRLLGDR